METTVVLATVAAAIVSFFICGIPFGLIIASRMNGIDVRKSGSGNIGMTNVARTAGGSAAALTFLCDVGKGTVCVLLSKLAISNLLFAGVWSSLAFTSSYGWVGSTVFAACVFGHVYSPYLHFHGGKGISVGLGASLALWWPLGLGAFSLFLLLAIPTGFISLGSVAAALSLPIISAIAGVSIPTLIPIVAVSVVVIWAHRENIGRLLRHEEHRFSIRSKGGEQGKSGKHGKGGK